MESVRKYIAEFIGTFILVTLGCGTAMLVGCDSTNGGGYILTALAFGLAIVAMAYSVGNISGGHVNPAVSLAVLMNGGMSVADFFGYLFFQCLGAIAGSGVLAMIFNMGEVTDMTGGYGTNGLGGVSGNAGAGILVEVVLTFIFVLAILGVTDSKHANGAFGGLAIGLTLTLIHLISIPLTNTSVNPARSISQAIFSENSLALPQLWLFIVAPLVGAALAGLCYKCITCEGNCKK